MIGLSTKKGALIRPLNSSKSVKATFTLCKDNQICINHKLINFKIYDYAK